MTYFITIAGSRWPVETTFRTGKDAFGWDQSQARTWDAINRHTALTALAQLGHRRPGRPRRRRVLPRHRQPSRTAAPFRSSRQ